jgi:transcriptional regulator with XRE-family HTH domain
LPKAHYNGSAKKKARHFSSMLFTYIRSADVFLRCILMAVKMDIDNFDKRMLAIRKQNNLSQRSFSDLVGVSPSYIALVELGKNRPSFNFIMSVLKTMQVSADWLLLGKGSMYPPIKKEEIKEINEDRVDYGAGNLPRDDDFKSYLDKLNDDQKRVLMVMAKEMIEKNEMKEFVSKLGATQLGELLQIPSLSEP